MLWFLTHVLSSPVQYFFLIFFILFYPMQLFLSCVISCEVHFHLQQMFLNQTSFLCVSFFTSKAIAFWLPFEIRLLYMPHSRLMACLIISVKDISVIVCHARSKQHTQTIILDCKYSSVSIPLLYVISENHAVPDILLMEQTSGSILVKSSLMS